MRKHEGYEEVIENGKSTTESEESPVGDSSTSKDDEEANERKDGNEIRKENEGEVLKKRGRKPKNK